MKARQYADGPWANADLLFLVSAVGQGMSLAEVAGFLGRREKEVSKQVALITPDRHRQDARRRVRHQKRRTAFAQTLITSKAG